MIPTVEWFGRTLGTYAICALVGFLVCGFIATKIAKNKGIVFEDIVLFVISSALGLLIGGHLLYALLHIKEIFSVVKELPEIGFYPMLYKCGTFVGGMVFYGGLFGAMVALRVHLKISKFEQKSDVIDIFAIVIPLFHVFGRIGCFLGGCCYGIPFPWGIIVTENIFVPEMCGIRRFPVSLLEASCNGLIFLFLLFLHHKGKENLLRVYLFVYSFVRFFTEMFRGDEVRGVWGGLSTSQWISLGLIFWIILFSFREKTRKKYKKLQKND